MKASVFNPNCLPMGQSTNKVPNDTALAEHMKKSERYKQIQQVTKNFWDRQSTEVTPETVMCQKWQKTKRNLQMEDIVLVHDESLIKV